ncbi:hypothetical protein RUM43_007037 [Polyplax serrata]|uniref:Uncharacterized protein n=1 Tax=Polyplax serrata TaxID=468196 RepID=A0AAN8P1B7_POLSC
MAPSDDGSKKKNSLPGCLTHPPPSSARLPHEYIQQLEAELQEEREEKEALNVERAKLKVCWEMTLEELAMTRTELSDKIFSLENELQKQMKWKKVLQKLLREYGENLEEMKGVIENILVERPKCMIKY